MTPLPLDPLRRSPRHSGKTACPGPVGIRTAYVLESLSVSLMRLLLLGLFLASAVQAQSTATFRVTLDASWSASTHPAGFPGNAHFSPLIGVAHDASVSVWAPGGVATDGIESMAERGVNTALLAEFEALRSAGHAGVAAEGPGIPSSPGSASMTLTVDEATPLLTVVSMLAPSPDWFVGVHGLDLRPNGAWAGSETALVAYDAGTDSGTDYTSANADTQPRGSIARLNDAPFRVSGMVPAVATLRVELLSTTADEAEAPAQPFALSAPAPNPSRGASSLILTVDRPQTVSVRVVDALGRTVAVLAEGPQPAGPLSLRFDSRSVAAGIYTVVARGEQMIASRRLVVGR